MDEFIEKISKVDMGEVFAKKSMQEGVKKYAKLTSGFWNTNVATDREFQKLFNGFYRVQRRNEEWYKAYYALMEKGKTQTFNFEKTLGFLYEETGRVEASFVSKLLHTLNNDMPIWDAFVLKNLEKKKPYGTGEKKIEKCVSVYDEIVAWYKIALASDEIERKIMEFDKAFPEYTGFSKTKKLDFMLWQMRTE